MIDNELEMYLENATNELKPSVRSYLKDNLEQIVKFILIFKSSTVKKDNNGKSKISEITGLYIEDSAYKNLVNFLKTKEDFKSFNINENSLRVYISSLAKEKGIDLVNKKTNLKSKIGSQSVALKNDSQQQTASSRSLINENNRTENVKKDITEVQVSQAPIDNDLETFLKEIKITKEEEHKIKVELNYFKTFNSIDILSTSWNSEEDIILKVFQFLNQKTNIKCNIFAKNQYIVKDLLLNKLVTLTKTYGSKFYNKCKINNKDTSWWE